MLKLTFTWDDGSYEDLKVADLSLKYNIPGMFFIPAKNPERNVITPNDIIYLDNLGFEIGAHTYSHLYLDALNNKQILNEISNGKSYLENILSKEIKNFCLPGGKYNKDIIDVSKQYFDSCRTADTGSLVERNSFLIKPTFHFYDRGKLSLFYNSFINSIDVFGLLIDNNLPSNYFDLLKFILLKMERSTTNYEIIIWGHGWEIENFNLYEPLEDLFLFINKNLINSKSSYSELVY